MAAAVVVPSRVVVACSTRVWRFLAPFSMIRHVPNGLALDTRVGLCGDAAGVSVRVCGRSQARRITRVHTNRPAA